MKAPSRLTQRWWFSAPRRCQRSRSHPEPASICAQPAPSSSKISRPPFPNWLLIYNNSLAGPRAPFREQPLLALSPHNIATASTTPQPSLYTVLISSPNPNGHPARGGRLRSSGCEPGPLPGGAHSVGVPAHLALKRLSPAAASSMSPPLQPPPPPPREGDPSAAPNCRRASLTSPRCHCDVTRPRQWLWLQRQEAEVGRIVPRLGPVGWYRLSSLDSRHFNFNSIQFNLIFLLNLLE